MQRVVLMLLLLLGMFGLASADVIVGATPVAVQSNPYDLEPLLGAGQVYIQKNESSGQPQLSSSTLSVQNSWLEAYTVVQAKYVGKEEATMDVNLAVDYDVGADKTSVIIEMSSPVVPAFVNVLVYTPEGELVGKYLHRPGSTNRLYLQLNGFYDALFVVVAGEGLAVAGVYDFTVLLSKFIYGTNIIPFKVNETGTYYIYSPEVEGVVPIVATSKLQTFYVIAKDIGTRRFYISPK